MSFVERLRRQFSFYNNNDNDGDNVYRGKDVEKLLYLNDEENDNSRWCDDEPSNRTPFIDLNGDDDELLNDFDLMTEHRTSYGNASMMPSLNDDGIASLYRKSSNHSLTGDNKNGEEEDDMEKATLMALFQSLLNAANVSVIEKNTLTLLEIRLIGEEKNLMAVTEVAAEAFLSFVREFNGSADPELVKDKLYEHTVAFIAVIENVLAHGLRTSSKSRKCGWYGFLECVLADQDEVLLNLFESLDNRNTPLMQGRGFLRYALSERLLAECMKVAIENRLLINEWYNPRALLAGRNASNFVSLLYIVESVPFELPSIRSRDILNMNYESCLIAVPYSLYLRTKMQQVQLLAKRLISQNTHESDSLTTKLQRMKCLSKPATSKLLDLDFDFPSLCDDDDDIRKNDIVDVVTLHHQVSEMEKLIRNREDVLVNVSAELSAATCELALQPECRPSTDDCTRVRGGEDTENESDVVNLGVSLL